MTTAGSSPIVRCSTLTNLGTLPKIESAEMMFSASRSRRLSIVPIIQSLGQLEKNYGKEGAEIIVDNTQVTHLRRICPQQRNCPSDEQIPGQPDGAERIGEQGQGQWLSVPADDRAAPYDPGRAEVHAQGSVHRDENRCLPHEGEAKAVFPVGDLLWRAVHGSRQRKPACGIRRQEGVGKGYPGEVPTAPSEERKTA